MNVTNEIENHMKILKEKGTTIPVAIMGRGQEMTRPKMKKKSQNMTPNKRA